MKNRCKVTDIVPKKTLKLVNSIGDLLEHGVDKGFTN